MREMVKELYRTNSGVRIRKGEMRLVDRLFSVIKLPLRLRRPRGSHSQTDVSLPLIVSSHLSSMRSTSIGSKLRLIFQRKSPPISR
jgi:hypothetical protein